MTKQDRIIEKQKELIDFLIQSIEDGFDYRVDTEIVNNCKAQIAALESEPETLTKERIEITESKLIKLGFNLRPIRTDFEGLEMPYYAKEGVLLFFNQHRTKYELCDYYIGYGSMRGGKYHVVAFRWIKYIDQLKEIYSALTRNDLTTPDTKKQSDEEKRM